MVRRASVVAVSSAEVKAQGRQAGRQVTGEGRSGTQSSSFVRAFVRRGACQNPNPSRSLLQPFVCPAPGPNYAQPSLKPTRRFSKPLVHARSRDPPSWDSLFGQVRACLHRFCWLCCGAMDQARPPPVVKQQPYSAPWQSLDRPRV
ncbi:hypothetical protein IWX50DRAFT_613601 [Phyllosticta citricarpa]|uniref:Uncharacterized protein n=1 Tax=Phyllosticta citricarpa TaxID=55181 RepID=A0ABR1M7A3_9PEZI